MKKVLGLLFVLLLAGCSTPVNPLSFIPGRSTVRGLISTSLKSLNIMTPFMGRYARTMMANMP